MQPVRTQACPPFLLAPRRPSSDLYRDVLAHYGVVALPCRVGDPDRKNDDRRLPWPRLCHGDIPIPKTTFAVAVRRVEADLLQ